MVASFKCVVLFNDFCLVDKSMLLAKRMPAMVEMEVATMAGKMMAVGFTDPYWLR